MPVLAYCLELRYGNAEYAVTQTQNWKCGGTSTFTSEESLDQ